MFTGFLFCGQSLFSLLGVPSVENTVMNGILAAAGILAGIILLVQAYGHAVGKNFWRDHPLPALLPLAWTIPLTVSEGAGAYAGLFLTARRHKAENGGQLSSSLWCYRTLAPLYVFILASSLFADALGTQLALIEGAFLLVGGFICFVVYRRSFRLKTSDIITLAAAFGAGILVSVLFRIV